MVYIAALAAHRLFGFFSHAVVTGASEGIGRCYALEVTTHGTGYYWTCMSK